MSGTSYVWEDPGHTAVFRYIDPPEPDRIDLVALQAAIDALTAEIAACQAQAISDADVRAQTQAQLDAGVSASELSTFVEDLVAGKAAVDNRCVALTAQRDQQQALLDTINAEATD